VADDREHDVAKVERRTLAEQVLEALRHEILEDQFPPGTELQEVALAESYGVSRGPIREALGRLSAEGLVTTRPRRGAVVTGLSKQEFLEAYQVREALEVLAVRLMVQQQDDGVLNKLDDLIREMDEADAAADIGRFFELNSAFHRLFIDASGNRRLQEVHAQVIGTMGRYRRRSLVLRGEIRPSIDEHRQIVAAARAGDADEAARLLSHHISVPQKRLLELTEEEFAKDFAAVGSGAAISLKES